MKKYLFRGESIMNIGLIHDQFKTQIDKLISDAKALGIQVVLSDKTSAIRCFTPDNKSRLSLPGGIEFEKNLETAQRWVSLYVPHDQIDAQVKKILQEFKNGE
jgi:hypothetical protein